MLAILASCVLAAPTPSDKAASPRSNQDPDVAPPSTSSHLVDVFGSLRNVTFHVPAQGSSTARRTSKRFNALVSGEDRALCGASIFVNRSTAGSPSAADCACVRDAAHNGKASFVINAGDAPAGQFYPVISCGTCRFGVDTENVLGTSVGNADIRDIVADAIARFEWEGRVGAEGEMGCENAFEMAKTRWAIYHT